MDLLLELLLQLVGDVVLGGLLDGLRELLRPAGGEVLSLLRRDRPPPGPRPLAACATAAVLGAVMGVAGAHLIPARLAHSGPAVVTTWLALPIGAGLTAWGVDHLRARERRDPAVALVAGLLFGLAYLGARAAARAVGG